VAAGSLRAHLLRMLLPPVGILLVLGAFVAYLQSREPATEAYDQALVDVAVALGAHIRVLPTGYSFELPAAVDRVLRSDRYDTVYYRVLSPTGLDIAGDLALAPPEESADAAAYPAVVEGREVRAVAVPVPCGGATCTVLVAETTVKRTRLARRILLTTLAPEMLIALATLVIVWFGVKRGLGPLARLSEEIRSRSPGDLRPIDATGAPEETRPLTAALNGLLHEVAEASRSQQRFLANATHQLRTPLAGLRAHTEVALAQELPAPARAQLEQVHEATVRTARLANQLLTLARAEPGARADFASLELKALVEREADAWVHQAMARDIDLGFELAEAPVTGDPLLVREALANLVHNALEYSRGGGRVTVRTGRAQGRAFAEVEDDGPGIPSGETARVLERFYRVPGTGGTGSGLGLAIVSEIAAGHGASVAISAGTGGKGCRVGITFPHG
jgi:two-component system sensor histidine kinase TctE